MVDLSPFMPSQALLDAALDYAHRGLPVFPCHPQTKRPLSHNGFKDATTDEGAIRSWWASHPNAMIGLPTGQRSGVWVLDIDDPEAFEAACPVEIPRTRRCDTGKGYHLYFEFDPAIPVTNAQRHKVRGWPLADLPGAETRGEGGYVIVPPSRHPSGRYYRWTSSDDPIRAPQDLLRLVTHRKRENEQAERSPAPARQVGTDTAYGLRALEDECSAVMAASDGEQESTLNEAGLKIGALVAGGELSPSTAKGRLIAAGLAMPSFNSGDRWTAEAIVAKVERGMSDGATRPRSAPERSERTNGGQRRSSQTSDDLGYVDEDGVWTAYGPDWDEPGQTGGQINALAPKRPAMKLKYEWAGKTEPVIDGFWLIDEWLPSTGIAVIYGHPGSGKSFLALHMAAHVCTGQKWAGREVEQGLVLYVVAEGQSGFRNRLYAMENAGQIPPGSPFAFVPTPIDLQAIDGDVDALIAAIEEAATEIGQDPAMVIVDTLSKTFGAGKENTDDMVAYVNNCQRIASHFSCLTVVVHHRPKDSESRDLRGHSSLRGNVDTAILVEAGSPKKATTLKQKDGEDNITIRFELERVVVGVDRKGNERTSCITKIVEDDAPSGITFSPIEFKKRKLIGHNKIGLKAIEEVIAKDGVEPPAEIPADAINRFKTWKAAKSGQVADRLDAEYFALVEADADKNPDSAKRTRRRVLKDLKSAGILGSWQEWVWVN